MATVAVMGVGDLGSSVLRMLACAPEVSRLSACDVDGERLAAEVTEAAAIASYGGRAPRMECLTVDMHNVDALAAAVDRVRPDVIVNTATLQSWWVITQLPHALWRRLEEHARYGPWLPMHLTLALKLMQAVRITGLTPAVVNVAFPDAVNPVLAGVGLAPTCGAGNSDLLRGGIRWAAARRLHVPVGDVTVNLLGHHFHVVYFWMGLESLGSLREYPYWLRVTIGNEDVTAALGAESLMIEAGHGLPKGRAIMARTAASAVEKVRALLGDTERLTHAPSPLGMIGGYDIRLSRTGARIVLPEGMPASQARAMMEQVQRGDGIDTIRADGTVVFTPSACAAMRDVLGYDCPTLSPNDAEARAAELRGRVAALARPS